ncbi:MAG TPA: hypothetical protein V6D11_08805 [Waterburya sp.]|jgi:hypothetical protein
MKFKSIILSLPIAALAFASIAPIAEAKLQINAFCSRRLTTLNWGGSATPDPGKSGTLTVNLFNKPSIPIATAIDRTSPYQIWNIARTAAGSPFWVKATFTQNDGQSVTDTTQCSNISPY